MGGEAPQSAARRAQQSILRDLPAQPSGVEELRFPIPRGKGCFFRELLLKESNTGPFAPY